ncbi:MAG: nickel-dependent lactate racemase [Crenarchaeota archaeon]|nr:nickel-dependent lactate racemase [Thermoproteota archaeon]
MVDVWLPYGKTDVCARIPARNLLGTIEPKDQTNVCNQTAEVERALQEPIGTKRLREIAKPESKVAIVVDETTYKSPSERMLTPVLAELNAAGVKDENITIIFGCGPHRPVTTEEAKKLLGEEAIKRINTISHSCTSTDLVYIGTTKTYGNKIQVNRVFAEADVKVLLGDINYHYYAGYGGGRKSVLPAVCGNESIQRNHSMLVNTNARTGNLENNPVHIDMTEAARLAKVDYIVNVVENRKGEIVKAFAGDLEAAFMEGVKLVDELYQATVVRRADIIVVSAGGYPADINLYQAYNSINNVLDAVKRGGVIILVAECLEGYGNQVFYDWMTRLPDVKSAEKEIRRNFVMGGHKALYLLKALQTYQIILVSSMPDFYATSIFKLKTARAVNDALNEALKITGSASRVWAFPQGSDVLPIYKAPDENKI